MQCIDGTSRQPVLKLNGHNHLITQGHQNCLPTVFSCYIPKLFKETSKQIINPTTTYIHTYLPSTYLVSNIPTYMQGGQKTTSAFLWQSTFKAGDKTMISKINEYMSLYPRDYLSSIGKKSVQLHFTISCPSKIRAVILI